MAKRITFADAAARFTNLATTGIGIEEAIQEAVNRIYEMGRWPGTTEEITLAESDFVFDADLDSWFISFGEMEYDGAIGFRNDFRGWSIVDQTVLYKDGVNAGDMEFVDYGTIVTLGVETRKYRAPLDFVPDAGPYYALMKKEAPELEADDLIPVTSLGALKCAIKAVCYEYVNDDERAMNKWGQFDQFITLSSRQVSGPKKYHIGMDSSLRRHPTQFR